MLKINSSGKTSYQLPTEMPDTIHGMILQITLEDHNENRGVAAVVKTGFTDDPDNGIFNETHEFGEKLLEAVNKSQVAVIHYGRYSIRGKKQFEVTEIPEEKPEKKTEKKGKPTAAESPVEDQFLQPIEFDTTDMLPAEQQPNIYWLEKLCDCPEDGTRLEKKREYIQLNDKNQKLSLWTCKKCEKTFAVIPFGVDIDEFKIKSDYLPQASVEEEETYYSPYYKESHECREIIKNRDFVNAAIIGTQKYYDFLNNKGGGLNSVAVIKKTRVDEGRDFRLVLEKNIKNPEAVQIKIDEKILDSDDLKPIEYSQELKQLIVRAGKGYQEQFEKVLPNRIKIVFDLKFLVSRVNTWYRQYGFMLQLPNQKPRVRYPDCAKLKNVPSANQSEAIHSILSYPLTYVWGAPGTGKTQLVLARSILAYIQGKKKVLVLAPTNNAIEQTLHGLLPVIQNAGYELKGLVLRLGLPTSQFASKYPMVCEDATFARLMAELSDSVAVTKVRIQDAKEIIKNFEQYAVLDAERKTIESCSAQYSEIQEKILAFGKEIIRLKNIEKDYTVSIQSEEKKINNLQQYIQKNEQKADSLLTGASKYQKGIRHTLWPTRWAEAYAEAQSLLEEIEKRNQEILAANEHIGQLRPLLAQNYRELEEANLAFQREQDRLADVLRPYNEIQKSSSYLTATNAEATLKRVSSLLSNEQKKYADIEEKFEMIRGRNKEDVQDDIARYEKRLAAYEAQMSAIQAGGSNSTVDSCQVIAATIDTFINRIHPDDGYNFDHIFLDEAGYCSVVKAATTTAYGCPVTLLGDHMQLPPICEMDSGDILKAENNEITYWSQSALYLEEAFVHSPADFYRQYRENTPPSFFYLNRNMLLYSYRFGPQLAEALSADVYEDEFYGNEKSKTEITYINVNTPHERKSRINEGEGEKICEYVLAHRNENIGIITPYNKQVLLIIQQLKEAGIKDVEVVTVHGSQGKEWDTVIFSVVDTDDRWYTDSALRKSKGLNLINTAVSRTKKRLIIVCNCDYWKRQRNQFITDLLTVADGKSLQKKTKKKPSDENVQPDSASKPKPVRKPIQPSQQHAEKSGSFAEKPQDERVNEILNYLAGERGVKYLVHFTVVDNLPGIMENGIVPRAAVPETAICLDEDRLDQMTDCSCFSLSFPNYRMFYLKRIQNRRKNFAVLLIDLEALRDLSYDDMYFFPSNAAEHTYKKRKGSMKGISAARRLFAKRFTDENSTRMRAENLPREYTTNPQSEVMIRGIIPSKYIHEIQVLDRACLQEENSRLPIDAYSKIRVTDFNFKERIDGNLWSSSRHQS